MKCVGGDGNATSPLQDLIEMVVNVQDAVEQHAKKQADLEDYIDALLTKVIANAPELLQENAQMEARFGHRLLK